MSGIFISYRRDDSRGTAGRLYDDLKDHFGKERVFRDLDAIEPGADYVVEIEDFIDSCDAVVVVIGNQWLDIRDEEGRPRLAQPADAVHQEVAAALRTAKPVIPVLVEDARMPTAAKLPEALSPLARRNALPLSDARWDYDVGRLLSRLEEVVPAMAPDVPGSAGPGRGPGRAAAPGWAAGPTPSPVAPAGSGWSGRYASSQTPAARPPAPSGTSKSTGYGWAVGAAAILVVVAVLAVVLIFAIRPGPGDDPSPTTVPIPPTGIMTTVPTTAPPDQSEPPVGETTITLSRSSGPAGTAVTVSGSGFDPNETVEISFHVNELATKVTDSRGAFSGVVIRVPSGSFKGAPYEIRVTGKRSLKSDGAPFNVT